MEHRGALKLDFIYFIIWIGTIIMLS